MAIDLVLFFTEGVSLQTWDSVGMLEREVAIYKALQERGVNTTFVTYGDEGDLAFREKIRGIEIWPNALRLPRSLYKVSFAMYAPVGNIVKSNQVAGADVAMQAAAKARAKFIARCGYLLSDFQTKKFGVRSVEVKQALNLEKKVFERADRVVVTTEAMAKTVVENTKVADQQIRVIPNYVETDRFSPMRRPANQKFRIGFVGRLDKQKNLEELIQSVERLDVELELVGYGPLQAKLEAIASVGGVTSFRGNLPNRELPNFLNSCDLFVMPSLYEGHPKALIEAMACGLPVIGTRVPGIRELIDDGVNGLLCDLDSESIRAAIQRAIEDPNLRENLGKNARSYAEKNFSLARILELELAVLNELVAE